MREERGEWHATLVAGWNKFRDLAVMCPNTPGATYFLEPALDPTGVCLNENYTFSLKYSFNMEE